MPNSNRYFQPYFPQGRPELTNYNPSGLDGPNYALGEVGLTFDINDRTFQRVKLDSGATSATPTGAVAVGQVLMWKDRAKYIVTNDSRFAFNSSGVANAFRDQVAGILMNAATPGYVIDVLQRGLNIPVASDGNGTKGEQAFMVATTTTPVVGNIAVGTGSGYVRVGFITGPASGGLIGVDVEIMNTP